MHIPAVALDPTRMCSPDKQPSAGIAGNLRWHQQCMQGDLQVLHYCGLHCPGDILQLSVQLSLQVGVLWSWTALPKTQKAAVPTGQIQHCMQD
jgi:hypothetical protein